MAYPDNIILSPMLTRLDRPARLSPDASMPRTVTSRGLLLTCLLIGALLTAPLWDALAHKVSAVRVVSHFDTKEQTFKVEMAMEVIPSSDEELNEQISPEEATLEMADNALQLKFGEQTIKPEPTIIRIGVDGQPLEPTPDPPTEDRSRTRHCCSSLP